MGESTGKSVPGQHIGTKGLGIGKLGACAHTLGYRVVLPVIIGANLILNLTERLTLATANAVAPGAGSLAIGLRSLRRFERVVESAIDGIAAFGIRGADLQGSTNIPASL